jgi:hypothetical protein
VHTVYSDQLAVGYDVHAGCVTSTAPLPPSLLRRN